MKQGYRVGAACLAIALSACGGTKVTKTTQTVTHVAASTAMTGWATYNGNVQSTRFAPESSIDASNVRRLARVCSVKMPETGAFQTGPVIVGKTMYVTTLHDTLAIDATSCRVLWTNSHKPKAPELYNTNRGVAYDAGRVFRGYQDGTVEALDASTGRVIWTIVAADPKKSEFFSAAPIAWNGVLYLGIAGADWGARGRMMAFRESDGKQIWRFDLIPQGSELGANTWGKASTAATGGGSTWTTYSLDPATDLLYVPVGNPAPDFSPEYRPGANLYTDSIVALDARSGKLAWYHQFVANDSHDYDMAAAPALITTRAGTPLVVAAGKNAMLYALDSSSHAMRYALPVSEIRNARSRPTFAGVHVCPGWIGGVEWNGPAYDPQTNALYVNSVHACGTYKLGEARFTGGDTFLGGEFVPDASKTWYGWVTAVDADSGHVLWKYRSPTPMIGAITPTAGGVVFTGDLDGNLLVFDARTGHKLLSLSTGRAIAGGVVAYEVGGTEYVACTSGNVSRLAWGVLGAPSIDVFTLRS